MSQQDELKTASDMLLLEQMQKGGVPYDPRYGRSFPIDLGNGETKYAWTNRRQRRAMESTSTGKSSRARRKRGKK